MTGFNLRDLSSMHSLYVTDMRYRIIKKCYICMRFDKKNNVDNYFIKCLAIQEKNATFAAENEIQII